MTNINQPTINDNEPKVSAFKCRPCQRRRLKCDMNMPHCNKCTKRGMECVYIYKPPRIRRPKDETYQAYVNKFSTKDDNELDYSPFNNNLAMKSSESIYSNTNTSPNKCNYDTLVDLNVSENITNRFEVKSNITQNYIVGSNYFVENNVTDLLSLTLSSPQYSSDINNNINNNILNDIDLDNYNNLIILAQESYFKNVNDLFPLFPIHSSQRWKCFDLVSDAITVLGLLYLPQDYSEINNLKNILEDKLLGYLSNNYSNYCLETLQFSILCYQIILISNSMIPNPFPILSQLGITFLNQAKTISEYFKRFTPNLIQLSRSNPFFSLELNSALDLLAGFDL